MKPIINKSRLKLLKVCSDIIFALSNLLHTDLYVVDRKKRKHLKLLLKNIQRKLSYLQSFDEKADNYILTCKDSDLIHILRFLIHFDTDNFSIKENNDGSFTYNICYHNTVNHSIINYRLSKENRDEIKSMFVVDIETSDNEIFLATEKISDTKLLYQTNKINEPSSKIDFLEPVYDEGSLLKYYDRNFCMSTKLPIIEDTDDNKNDNDNTEPWDLRP